ncbi:hypothetical protein ACKWTF_013834 [Chironomus riparius]
MLSSVQSWFHYRMERIRTRTLKLVKFYFKMIQNFTNKPEFYIQIKILNAIRIFQVPTRRQKLVCKIFQVYSLGTLIICLYGALNFIVHNFRNLSEVLEVTPALVGSVFALINFFSILFHQEEFFHLFDEIQKLNKLCKI